MITTVTVTTIILIMVITVHLQVLQKYNSWISFTTSTTPVSAAAAAVAIWNNNINNNCHNINSHNNNNNNTDGSSILPRRITKKMNFCHKITLPGQQPVIRWWTSVLFVGCVGLILLLITCQFISQKRKNRNYWYKSRATHGKQEGEMMHKLHVLCQCPMEYDIH